MSVLSSEDLQLVQLAEETIRKRYREGYHHIGAALRTASGRVHAAVHLEAHVGRAAVCAEAVALGMAAADGDSLIQVIVAVDRFGNVVSPCGICRELLLDYSAGIEVILREGDGLARTPLSDLLPFKYRRAGG